MKTHTRASNLDLGLGWRCVKFWMYVQTVRSVRTKDYGPPLPSLHLSFRFIVLAGSLLSCTRMNPTQSDPAVPSPCPMPSPSVSLFHLSVLISAFPPSPLPFSSLSFSPILHYSSLFSSCPYPSRCWRVTHLKCNCAGSFAPSIFVFLFSYSRRLSKVFSGRIFLRNLGQSSCRGNKYARGTPINGALFILHDAAGSG
jgi:hypothetical protein